MQRVRAYRNLNIRDHVAYSLQDAKTKLVIGYTPEILLVNVEFKISEAGRQRVIRDKSKNVHAFVIGDVWKGKVPKGKFVRIRYNPYLFDSFVLASDQSPIVGADAVRLDQEGAHALNPVRLMKRNGAKVPEILNEIDLWNG